MPGSVTLHATLADGEQVSHTFSSHTVVVAGRSNDCGIRLPPSDTSASRHHFLLEISPPKVLMRDLGGTAGTVVDGERHGGCARGVRPMPEKGGPALVRLRDGARIEAGRSTFVVEITPAQRCPVCGRSVVTKGVCTACRATVRPGETPTGLQTMHACTQCGTPPSESDGASARSDWVCAACRNEVGSDPLRIYERDAPSTDDVRASVPGFDVVSRLGNGGMGAVYLARRHEDGMWSALKVLLARVAVDDNARIRFERESQLIEQLDHPNIVQFFERGSDGALFYLAMELCGGGSVDRLMERRGGSLTLHEAGPIILQLLSALDYAHQKELIVELEDGRRRRVRGLVHRDVKPANLLLAGSERRRVCKLSDFGLAKSFAAAGLSGCTVTGQMGGTLRYMPPEQVSGFRDVTPSADLWCVGSSFYEMLTGRDPRDLGRSHNPFQAILDGKITPLRTHDPRVPDQIASVIERALERSPDDRHPDAGTMRSALLRALYGTDPSWSSDVPGSSAGTVLLPACEQIEADAVALFHVGVGAVAAQTLTDLESLGRISAVHRSVSAQPASARLLFLKCTGDGFLGACRDADDALSIARGVLMDCYEPRLLLRGAVHRASVNPGGDGDIAGVEVEWLLSVQDLEQRMRVDDADATGELPARRRVLITAAAHECLSERRRVSLAPLGRYKLPRFGRPESVWTERFEP